MDILIGIALGILISAMFINWLAKRIYNRIVAEVEEKVEAKVKRIEIEAEVVNGVIYCYNIATNSFVCQGRDITEIRSNFRQRFPDCDAAIVKAPKDLFSSLNEQLKEINENLSSK